jgi:hypothetical protein
MFHWFTEYHILIVIRLFNGQKRTELWFVVRLNPIEKEHLETCQGPVQEQWQYLLSKYAPPLM